MLLKLSGSGNPATDINRLFAATVAGALSTAFLYTVFGFIFCHVHAGRISLEMALLAANGLTPVIKPDDTILSSLINQFGAGTFFGLTLGLLIGIAGAVSGLFLWFIPDDFRHKNILLLILSVLMATSASVLGFSREMPALSIIFGILSPVFFFLPWSFLRARRTPKQIPKSSWFVLILIICAPLILLRSQSYELIRDVMADTPMFSSINDFYYEHTLLAADVIKPVSYRTQNAIAVSDTVKEISGPPNGSLFIISPEACSVKGAVLVASTEVLKCKSAVIQTDSGIVSAESILKSDVGDPNRLLRAGIGTFLKGPIIAVPIVILGWVSFAAACLFRKKPLLAVILAICYIAAFIPAFYHYYLRLELYKNPSVIHEYASSSSKIKRYLVLVYMLDKNIEHSEGLYPDELRSLAADKKAGTRLNALVFAGNLRNAEFTDMIEASLKDPQLNVRTKAVWALGNTKGEDAIKTLEDVLKSDPSWYVRDYAYNSLSKLRPEALVVRKGT